MVDAFASQAWPKLKDSEDGLHVDRLLRPLHGLDGVHHRDTVADRYRDVVLRCLLFARGRRRVVVLALT
jgi:hypothetical protein